MHLQIICKPQNCVFIAYAQRFWRVFGAFDLVLADGFFANSVLENSYFSSTFIKVSTTREVDVNPVAGRNVFGPEIWHFGSNFIHFPYEFTMFPEGDFALVKCQVFLWVFLLFRDAKMDKNPSARSKGKLIAMS